MVIGIITARQGSKRLKNKNIRLIKKKPFYSWSIKTLKKTKLFSKIVVTTDHPSIIKNAAKYGADIVLKRKKKLANSKASIIDVIKDVISELKNKKINFNYVCCMFPVSPLTKSLDIKRSYYFLKKNKNKFIFPAYNKSGKFVSEKYYNKFVKINTISKKKKIILNNFYVDAGQFYFSSKKNWLKKNNIIEKNNIILIKKNSELRDVNTLNDLIFVRKKIFKNNEILH